jgi:hypothetical protein
MLDKGMKLDDLPVKVWSACLPKPRRRQGTRIPAEVREAIYEENPGSHPGSHPRSRKNACGYEMIRGEIQKKLGLKDEKHFRE